MFYTPAIALFNENPWTDKILVTYSEHLWPVFLLTKQQQQQKPIY